MGAVFAPPVATSSSLPLLIPMKCVAVLLVALLAHIVIVAPVVAPRLGLLLLAILVPSLALSCRMVHLRLSFLCSIAF